MGTFTLKTYLRRLLNSFSYIVLCFLYLYRHLFARRQETVCHVPPISDDLTSTIIVFPDYVELKLVQNFLYC